MDVNTILDHLCKADEEFTRLYCSAQGDKSLVENNLEYKLAIAKAYESAKHLGAFIGKNPFSVETPTPQHHTNSAE